VPDDFYKRVQAYFLQAIEMESLQLEAFLSSLERDDPEALAEVTELLSARNEADAYFDEAVIEANLSHIRNLTLFLDQQIFAEEMNVSIPSEMGPFKIHSLLGKGGMGLVFRAVQTDADLFYREVALKVVNPEFSDVFRSNLSVECRALARLNNDNIARFYDFGQTDDGLDYMVLEYVEGSTLIDYCLSHNLILRERLQLLLQICNGTIHAHARKIIHGDIKPGNILISHQEQPVAKIIDFGLSQSKIAGFTTDAPHMGSPSYMSPEAVDGNDHLDTRSDIYALGTLLFELITGESVFCRSDFTGLQLDKALSLIKNKARSQPSKRIYDLASKNRDASVYGINSIKAARKATGDLDGIASKAMALNPDDRYQTVLEFKNDLTNYLESKPVSTVQHTWFYLLRKWISRHQIQSTLLFTAIVVLGTSLLTLNQTIEAKKDVEQSLHQLQSTQEFYDQMLKIARPVEKGVNISFVDAIRIWVFAIDGFTRGDLQLEANLRKNMAETLLALDENTLAKTELETILDLYRKTDQLETANHGAVLRLYGLSQLNLNEYSKAGSAFGQALEISRNLGHEGRVLELTILSGLSIYHRKLNDRENAELLAEQAYKGLVDLVGPEHGLSNDAGQILANVWIEGRQYERAGALLEKINLVQSQRFGDNHPTAAVSALNLAILYQRQGQYEKSEALYRKIWSSIQARQGPLHHYIFRARHGVAFSLWGQGRNADAEVMLEALIKDLEAWLGPIHRETLSTQFSQSRLLSSQGKHQQAVDLLQYLVQTYDHLGWSRQLQPLQARNNLGNSLRKLGRLEDALQILEKTYNLMMEVSKEETASSLDTRITIGQTLLDMNRRSEALICFEEAVSFATGRPEMKLAAARYRIYQGQCLGGMNRYEEAETMLKESLQALDGHPWRNEARDQLNNLYQAWGKPERIIDMK